MNRTLLLLLLLAAILAVIYNAVILVGKAPDEDRHMSYVRVLAEEHVLPYQVTVNRQLVEYRGAHTFHPPLYYIALLPLYEVARLLPEGWRWHVVRLGSTALCLGALWLLYGVALGALGDSRWASLVVAQLALLPMFGMTAASINNDSAAFFCISLLLWLLAVRYPRSLDWHSAVWFGVALALGTLCKASVLWCGLVMLPVYLFLQRKQPGCTLRQAGVRAAIILVLVLTLAGWWHVRSMMLYGTWNPMPPPAPSPALPPPEAGKLVVMLHPAFPIHVWWAVASTFTTFWSQKDWWPQPDLLSFSLRTVWPWRSGFDLLLAGYCGVGLLGLCRRPRSAIQNPLAWWLPIVALVALWLVVLEVALFYHWGWAEGGRYLFPAGLGLALPVIAGWRGWLSDRHWRMLLGGWLLFAVLINGVALYWLLAYLNPTYGHV